MPVIDLVVLVLLAAGFLIGILRGFLLQATGLVGLLCGLVVASRYYTAFRDGVLDRLHLTSHNGAVSFVSIVLGTILAVALLSALLRKILEHMQLTFFDRLAGGLFGALKASVILCGVLLAVVAAAPAEGIVVNAMWSSRSAPALWSAMEKTTEVLPVPEMFRDRAQDLLRSKRPASQSGSDTAE